MFPLPPYLKLHRTFVVVVCEILIAAQLWMWLLYFSSMEHDIWSPCFFWYKRLLLSSLPFSVYWANQRWTCQFSPHVLSRETLEPKCLLLVYVWVTQRCIIQPRPLLSAYLKQRDNLQWDVCPQRSISRWGQNQQCQYFFLLTFAIQSHVDSLQKEWRRADLSPCSHSNVICAKRTGAVLMPCPFHWME